MLRLALSLDTSTAQLSAALVIEDSGTTRALAVRTAGPPQQTSTLVPGVFDELLLEAGLKLGDVHVLVCGIGPGLFTGVRVAVSTMKAIAYARRLPLIGAGSLEAMAARAARSSTESSLLCPALDARKGEVYFALFQNVRGVVTVISPPEACPPAALATRLAQRGEGVRVFGTGAAVVASRLESGSAIEILEEPMTPGAVEVAELALLRNPDASFNAADVLALEPFYLRPPEAEVARRKREAAKG